MTKLVKITVILHGGNIGTVSGLRNINKTYLEKMCVDCFARKKTKKADCLKTAEQHLAIATEKKSIWLVLSKPHEVLLGSKN